MQAPNTIYKHKKVFNNLIPYKLEFENDQLWLLANLTTVRYRNHPNIINIRAKIERDQDPCKITFDNTENLGKKNTNGGKPANVIQDIISIKWILALLE